MTIVDVAVAAIAGAVLLLLGGIALAVFQESRPDRVPALLYHRFLHPGLRDQARALGVDLSYVTFADAFDEQMGFLERAGYAPITLRDFVAWQRGEAALPAKPILITCDDGFESVHRFAWPVWRARRMKATVFVTPDREAWNFRKHSALDGPLTPAQVREMAAGGVAIESHGMTHAYLSRLSRDQVLWELRESKRVLEALRGEPVRFFAVPGGDYDARLRGLLQEAGYEASFCVLKGTNRRGSDPYRLRRLTVGPDHRLEDFARLLHPATCWKLRLVSTCHEWMTRVLGPQRSERFEVALKRLGARRLFLPGAQARLWTAAILVLGLTLVLLAAWVVLR
ncbi:MAG TPA: polysaccharide deacetylase family protein [Candidatus Polarisedimenticolia bacterium]|nr:polysaccharide deacetylase family protein [Candidatus Polarisedimenticolia bacterium]